MKNVSLNPDASVVQQIREGLKQTGGYCPCRVERTPENKCMCEEFRNQIADPDFEGFCHCMLYYKAKDGSAAPAAEVASAVAAAAPAPAPAPAPAKAHPQGEITITAANFEEEVLHSDLPVLLDFWAPWCGPCRNLSPIIAEIAKENAGKLKVGKVNTDEEPRLAQAFRVSGIPAIFVVKDGAVTASTVGYQPKEQLLALLNQM